MALFVPRLKLAGLEEDRGLVKAHAVVTLSYRIVRAVVGERHVGEAHVAVGAARQLLEATDTGG